MKLIKPNVEYIPQAEGLEGGYKQIELAGRTCYKSDDKITEDSAKEFVDRMVKSGHGAMLEHGTVYLTCSTGLYLKYVQNKYSKVTHVNTFNHKKDFYITTNYRVIMQGGYDTYEEAIDNNFDKNWLDDLQYICEPTEHHEKRLTFRFDTQIAITREFNRHRVNSMAEQSTRYCNYSKDKFNNEISINLPEFIQKQEDCQSEIDHGLEDVGLHNYCDKVQCGEDDDFTIIDYWLFANLACEYSYMNMIRLGAKPQEARVVLPIDTNSELVHTAFVSDWKHFLSLRSVKYGAKGVHPDAVVLADMVYDKLKELQLID